MSVNGLIRSLWREGNALLRLIWMRLPVHRGRVLYESFAGNGALCNPEAIFRQLLVQKDMRHLRHTWVVGRSDDFQGIRREFAGDRRVRFVRRGGPAYFRALATSGYLINNATFPPEWSKRPEQVYLNTWHGTPLKRMGYDLPSDGALEAANTMRNFLSADYLLSQNPFMTTQMYEGAYRLKGLFTGRIIEGAYPRMDRQLLERTERAAAQAALRRAGIPIDERELILYAPTWRGGMFASPEDNAGQLIEVARRLQDALGSDRYLVLVKSHQVVSELLSSNPSWSSVVVPNTIPTNLLLGLTSALVTDFSSVFFDFLPMPGPIVFYAPDADAYLRARGTYFEVDELPGAFCDDIQTVAEIIRTGGSRDPLILRRRERWRARFTPRNDGKDSRRVIDVVFRGQTALHPTLDIADDPRTSLLLHIGSMNSNGITSAALNLIGALDPDRVDVSVVFGQPDNREQSSANRRLLPAHVRQFIRPTTGESRLERTWRRVRFFLAQKPARRVNPRSREAWQRQWRSVFGFASFDHVVDFDGYGPYWANLMLSGSAETHSIWLHNEMSAEQHRLIGGRERLRRSLGAVFALYPRFDSLVSVSPLLSEVNRETLAGRLGIRPDAFRFAHNVIDGRRVLLGATATPSDDHDIDRASDAQVRPILEDHVGTTWFLTIGRLSVEKNHRRLVNAFGRVHAAHPDTRLMIVGDGPLRAELTELIRVRGLVGKVVLAGFRGNPFALLAKADCFVVSSDYEGQPMVIMEAAILGRPIVSTEFGTIRDALPESTIHVVARSEEALAQGMVDFLDGRVRAAVFDFADYNDLAASEFESATGITRTPLVTVFLVGSDGMARAALGPVGSRRDGIHVVGSASTVAESATEIDRRNPRVVVLDGLLADGNGIELARRLRDGEREICCVVLASHDQGQRMYGAITVTAAGFTVVDIPESRLIETIAHLATDDRSAAPVRREAVS